MLTDENPEPATGPAEAAQDGLPDHPVRIALLDLLAEHGTLTSTDAARRLGLSSGLCSFHLRQLARHRLIEEAPHDGGRARPWRLLWGTPDPAAPDPAAPEPPPPAPAAPRTAVPAADGFSDVLRLTADQAAELGAAMRELIDLYRDAGSAGRGAVPVAATVWLVPLTGA